MLPARKAASRNLIFAPAGILPAALSAFTAFTARSAGVAPKLAAEVVAWLAVVVTVVVLDLPGDIDAPARYPPAPATIATPMAAPATVALAIAWRRVILRLKSCIFSMSTSSESTNGISSGGWPLYEPLRNLVTSG